MHPGDPTFGAAAQGEGVASHYRDQTDYLASQQMDYFDSIGNAGAPIDGFGDVFGDAGRLGIFGGETAAGTGAPGQTGQTGLAGQASTEAGPDILGNTPGLSDVPQAGVTAGPLSDVVPSGSGPICRKRRARCNRRRAFRQLQSGDGDRKGL